LKVSIEELRRNGDKLYYVICFGSSSKKLQFYILKLPIILTNTAD